MNFSLIQLEYVIAVDTWRNFNLAAEKCFITQPTLSMQIQKMEEALGIKLFDRSKKPVVPTEMGKVVIQQARKVLAEAGAIGEVVSEQKDHLDGTLKIAVIPTLAPYLLPLFIIPFLKSNPFVQLQIIELKTADILEGLKKEELDGGILSTPIKAQGFFIRKLFLEEFTAYVSSDAFASSKTLLTLDDLSGEHLWMVEEGHCFREQVINFCALKEVGQETDKFLYKTGNIDTLVHLVDLYGGVTFVPQLATTFMDKEKTMHLRFFEPPVPSREISLVTHRDQVKKRLLQTLTDHILESLKTHLRHGNI